MATRTISVAGGNFNSTSAWDEGVVPVAGDAVVARAGGNSGNLTVNVPSASASLILTNYSGTLTFDSTLTTTSTVTFVAACTIAGTAGTLACTAAATLTSGGKTLTCALTLTGSVTYTLGDNWTVNGLVTLGSTTSTTSINSNQITCNGGLHHAGTTATVAGTAKVVIAGGTWDSSSSGRLLMDVDLAGNVTVSGAVGWGTTGKTLARVSGTITTAGSTLTVASASTFATAGMTWANVTLTGSVTYTFSSTFDWSGSLTTPAGCTFSGAGALSGTGSWTPAGSVTINNTGGLTTTGTLTLPNAALTFAGSAGWTVGTLTTATLSASRTHTLTFGNTYRVTTALGNVGATATVRQALVSSSAGNKVVFTVDVGATLTLSYCDPTDIDSSAGGQVVSTGGTITTSLNWAGSVVASSGYPAVTDVRSGVGYGAGLTGTLASPAQADVKTGVQYGAGGTQYTGTYTASGGGPRIHF
jgi:fibronectin-binding autotransporter adhesin